MSKEQTSSIHWPVRLITVALLMSGTVLGIAGTDLVLPAVPTLPDVLGGTPAQAQFVLASYVLGLAVGLVVFGELGARFSQVSLLLGSMAGFALVAGLCAVMQSVEALSATRLLQGLLAAAPAVFVPGWIRTLYGEESAVRVFGVLGSLEALTPALAPIAGFWLVSGWGWRSSFVVLALIAVMIFIGLLLSRASLSRRQPEMNGGGGYRSLVGNVQYLRHALAHALTLSGLLVFVFGIGAVFVRAFGYDIERFVIMQVSAVACFIVAANLASRVVHMMGRERAVLFGSAVSAGFSGLMLGYALFGGSDALIVTLLFCGTGLGLGFRGPPGFFSAIAASRGNDSRAAAILLLMAFALTGVGTAASAASVDEGMTVLALTSFLLSVFSVIVLIVLPESAKQGERALSPRGD